MRKYQYLNNEDARRKEVAYRSKGISEKYVFQKSSIDIFYLVCNSIEEFYAYYSAKRSHSRMYNEVINDEFGPRKFVLDIDGRIKENEMKYVLSTIKKFFCKLTNRKPDILLYDISTSHHIVVNNLCFNASSSEIIAGVISEKVSERYSTVASLMDLGVYKKVQMFRIEGSTKYKQRRWKYLNGTNELSSMDDFKRGLISYTEDCYYIDSDRVVDLSIDLGVYQLVNREDIPKKRSAIIPDGFVIRKTMGNLVVLDRVSPSYCEICKRIHDHDGAYIAHGKFYCRRAI